MESRVYGNGLSSGAWQWHAGPEVLSSTGDSSPRRGLGAFVNANKHPGAIVVNKGSYKHSIWLRFPGSAHDLYVCAAHVPLYSQPLARASALAEISAGFQKYRKGTLHIWW